MDVVSRDLKDMGITWDEAEELVKKEQNGVNLRPNVSIWMWDELRC